MEMRIGSSVRVPGGTVQAEERPCGGCSGCALQGAGPACWKDMFGPCRSDRRSDGKNIVFTFIPSDSTCDMYWWADNKGVIGVKARGKSNGKV